MLPLAYTETAAYDAALDVRVEADGTWVSVGGSYVSHRRAGQLDASARDALVRALAALAPAPDAAAEATDGPDAAAGPTRRADAPPDFARVLVWAGGERRWHGPPPAGDPALAAVLAHLRRL